MADELHQTTDETDLVTSEGELREAIWVAIHSAVDAPALQITEACIAVLRVLEEREPDHIQELREWYWSGVEDGRAGR